MYDNGGSMDIIGNFFKKLYELLILSFKIITAVFVVLYSGLTL